METTDYSCDLCGLFIPAESNVGYDSRDTTYRFCCKGCRQVFVMLMEASGSPDPASFRHTDLFRKCQDMGIIPRSEKDLKPGINRPAPARSDPSIPAPPVPFKDAKTSDENFLELRLKISDMWCPACAWVIEEALKKSSGIFNVNCNFSMDRARCKYNPIETSPNRIVKIIESLGYKAARPEDTFKTERDKDLIRFAISAFLTMNVMMLSLALYTGFFSKLSPDTIYKISWPIFIMATVVFFYGGRKIYKKALAGLSSAAFSMETLITAGSSTAYLYSTINLFSGSIHLYFDTSSMLITLVLLGKLLERRARDNVQMDLESFFSLQPKKVKTCNSLYPQGRYVDIGQLRAGEIFQISENEIIAADGRVTEGAGGVDESSLTGEAQPVNVKPGDRVKSGTTVLGGTIRVRADGVGENSTLGQMIQIMERTLDEKIPMEGKTDAIMKWFIPAILIFSMGTGIACILLGFSRETALIRAITVMVISCPCTLGIAIPLARVAGISVASQKGILVRNFDSFEKIGRVTSFVFDKTGTITQGRWSLLDIIVIEPFSRKNILTAAAALEKNLNHPVASEIIRRAESRHLDIVDIEGIDISDNGISGYIGGQKIKIGSKNYLAKELDSFDHSYREEETDDAIHSTVFMSWDNRICAIFVFGDKIKPTTIPVVDRLHAMGYRTYLVSGDGDRTTQTVADKAGIPTAYGNMLPQEKARFVGELQKKGQSCAMIGDGINDAPALIQADLSMAIYSGGQLGEEMADITLMRSDPAQVLDFLSFATRVNQKIFQNLVYAFLYNIISIPVAMSGLLNPLIAVCAMLLSSLTVIGNTLLLIRNASQAPPDLPLSPHV